MFGLLKPAPLKKNVQLKTTVPNRNLVTKRSTSRPIPSTYQPFEGELALPPIPEGIPTPAPKPSKFIWNSEKFCPLAHYNLNQRALENLRQTTLELCLRLPIQEAADILASVDSDFFCHYYHNKLLPEILVDILAQRNLLPDEAFLPPAP